MLQLPQPRCREAPERKTLQVKQSRWDVSWDGLSAPSAKRKRKKKSHKLSFSCISFLHLSVPESSPGFFNACLTWFECFYAPSRGESFRWTSVTLVPFFFHPRWNESKLHFSCHKHFAAAGMLFAFVFDFARKRRIPTRELQTTRTDVQNVIYVWKVLFLHVRLFFRFLSERLLSGFSFLLPSFNWMSKRQKQKGELSSKKLLDVFLWLFWCFNHAVKQTERLRLVFKCFAILKWCLYATKLLSTWF